MPVQMARAPGCACHTAKLAEKFGPPRNPPARPMRCLAWAGPSKTRYDGCGALLVRPAGEIRLDTDGGCCTLDWRCRLKGGAWSKLFFLADSIARPSRISHSHRSGSLNKGRFE